MERVCFSRGGTCRTRSVRRFSRFRRSSRRFSLSASFLLARSSDVSVCTCRVLRFGASDARSPYPFQWQNLSW